MTRIDIKDLRFSYADNKEILHGITISFEAETIAIVGQNGAGKTTFVKLLKGLLKPTAGEILLDGKNISEYTVAKLANYIGMVYQNPNDQIFKNNVVQEVMFGPLNIGFSENDAYESAKEALEMVGLSDMEEKNPYDLSLSERKMVTIASILAMNTDVVIFDEPTMGQDFIGKEKIKQIIHELKEKGKLVICILHDMDFAAEVFERIVVFNQGNILLDGPAKEVFANKTILEQAYLEQPYVTQVANHLGLTETFLTVDEIVHHMKKMRL